MTTNKLEDLANRTARSTIAVVDTLAQRGAFKGEELQAIGTLRDQAVQIVQIVETLASERAAEAEVAKPKGK